jgi:hypothetical protein
MGNRLISLLVLVLLAGVGAYFFSPWFRTKVDDTIKNMKAWDAEARRKDPAGFIDFAMKELGSNIGKFEGIRADLTVATRKLEKMKGDHEATLAFAGKELDSFRRPTSRPREARVAAARAGPSPWPAAPTRRASSRARSTCC